MSRAAAPYSMVVTRGATWEEEFTYVGIDGITPINLSGYSARMQVRTLSGRYGTSTTSTLVLELTTSNGLLVWNTAALGKLRIIAPPASHAVLNPNNVKKIKYSYSIEVYLADYVLPLVTGKISVRGETSR